MFLRIYIFCQIYSFIIWLINYFLSSWKRVFSFSYFFELCHFLNQSAVYYVKTPEKFEKLMWLFYSTKKFITGLYGLLKRPLGKYILCISGMYDRFALIKESIYHLLFMSEKKFKTLLPRAYWNLNIFNPV